MNLLKEVLKNEVYPALGCTEPVALAYACAIAAKTVKLKDFSVFSAVITTDPGTYKNGFAVKLPNSGGEAGNIMACALGFLIQKPEMKYSIFASAGPETIKKAKAILASGRIKLKIDYTKKDFFAEVSIKSMGKSAVCVLSSGHFNVTFLSLNGRIIKKKNSENKQQLYREFLKEYSFKDLVLEAQKADKKDLAYIKKGVLMNLFAAKKGLENTATAAALSKRLLKEDSTAVFKAKIQAAAATDARMGGTPIPVMSSGQSGNQGVVATILPWIYGLENKKEERLILESIALAHLVNAYIKTFLGELSPICGCAVSSGAGAACALAYQNGKDWKNIEKAANNVIADLGGMFCDGAKSSCALKVASACDCAHRSAVLAMQGWAPEKMEGFIGHTFSETVKNLARLSIVGMSAVDSIIIETMAQKAACSR